MGLDMMLYRRTYIGAKFEHNDAKVEVGITLKGESIPINPKRLTWIYEEMGYWRKANAIHGWFVENYAQGEDNCQEIHVSTNGLKRLLEICRNLLGSRSEEMAMKELPPCEGFFFGGTGIDEYYWQTIEETEAILEETLGTHDNKYHEYIYQASW